MAEAKDKTSVVFDIGNVLVRWDPRHLFRKTFGGDDAAMEKFIAEACAPDWVIEFDRGRLFEAGIAERIAAFPHYEDHLRAFDTRWLETITGVIGENVDVMRRLRAQGEKIYSITNFSAEKFEVAREVYPFFGWFDGIVVSGREKLIKPDLAIFELFLSRFGLSAHRTLFVDDSAANVAAAQKAGMQAIHFTDAVDLAKELESRGLLNA